MEDTDIAASGGQRRNHFINLVRILGLLAMLILTGNDCYIYIKLLENPRVPFAIIDLGMGCVFGIALLNFLCLQICMQHSVTKMDIDAARRELFSDCDAVRREMLSVVTIINMLVSWLFVRLFLPWESFALLAINAFASTAMLYAQFADE